MFQIRILVLVVFVLLFENIAQCQENKLPKKITVLPVPTIGYSPETKTYVGAVTLFTFNNTLDSLTRSSNASVEFNYTWNKQMIIETDWNYFFPKEVWFTRGLLHYSKYPDLYYGIGFDTPDSGELNFQSKRLILNIDLLRNIKNKIFLGLGLNYKAFNSVEYQNDTLFYPELKSGTNYGLNIVFLKDSRNNILSPSKGNYFEFKNVFNFTNTFYFTTTIDFRHYYSFGKNANNTLASRFYHTTVFGEPPFYDYAEIGGDKYVRGYYQGRYRDNNFSSVQMELRNHLFWRIGIATFGGVSMIYEYVNNIKSESFKPNAGVGIRFLVDKNENTNLRFDYAVGVGNQSGFYISFGESF